MTKLIALLALVILGSTAHADSRSWSMNAGGCVPTDVDIMLQGTHYWTVTGGMRVKYRQGTDTNDINLVCPVTSLNPSVPAPTHLVVYSGNTTGRLTCAVGNRDCPHYVVIATLHSVDLYDGTYGTLCTTSTNVSEFALSNNNGPWIRSYCPIPALNPNRYQYWVELTVHRDNASGFPEVNAVELSYDPNFFNALSDGDGDTHGGPAY